MAPIKKTLFLLLEGSSSSCQIKKSETIDEESDELRTCCASQKMSAKTRKVTQMRNELMLVDLENVSNEQVVNLEAQWNALETNTYATPILCGNIEFCLTKLPDGNYYQHIYNDADSKPVMQKILVEH